MEISGDMGPMAINYQKMVEQMLQNRDQNDDGVLSIEEIAIPKEAFAKIDKNDDSLLENDELKAFFPTAHLDRIATDFIKEQDANGDGLLTIDEVAMPQELFNKADTNADRQLDRKELAEFAEQHAKQSGRAGKKPGGKGKGDDETTESIVEIDTDGDGIADTEEVTTLNAKGEVQTVITRPIGESGAIGL